jgi:molecular chaperone DnaJ
VTKQRNRPATSTTASARTDATVEIELPLSVEQAAIGTAVVPIRETIACPACNGTGTDPREPPPCPSCAGAGSNARLSGGIIIRTECTTCRGTRHQPPQPCRRCGASRVVSVERDVAIRVPTGTEPGTRLPISVPGTPSPPVELGAVARVAAHPYFERRGNDLVVRCPITLAEAALGAVVSVPTLDGAVAIRVPPGTPHGRTLRVRAQRVAYADGRGDLLVQV